MKPSCGFDASVFSVSVPEPSDEIAMRDLMDLMTRYLKSEIAEANSDILSVVRSLAGDVGRYKRERNRALKAVVRYIRPLGIQPR